MPRVDLPLAAQSDLREIWNYIAQDCRSYPLGKYCFYYRPTEDGILLLRVLHSARDIRQISFPG